MVSGLAIRVRVKNIRVLGMEFRVCCGIAPAGVCWDKYGWNGFRVWGLAVRGYRFGFWAKGLSNLSVSQLS